MSGENQHFIPQFFLRGFKVRPVRDGKRAWLYTSNAEPELKYIWEIAAGFHFYSAPYRDSLDDKITKYENLLARKVKALRKQPPGSIADSSLPSEVVAHLTVRTESVRSTVSLGAKQLALGAYSVFTDEASIRHLLGLGLEKPNSNLKKMIDDVRQEYAEKIEPLGLSAGGFERVFYGLLKERFPDQVNEMRRLATQISAQMYLSAETAGLKTQNKLLNSELVPTSRKNLLQQLNWETVACNEPIVLPDCIAVALDSQNQSTPFAFSNSNEVASVVMPLDSERLLIGRNIGVELMSPTLFNLHAISCSSSFFVSAVRSQELIKFSQYIGVTPKIEVIRTINSVTDEFKAPTEKTPALPPPNPQDINCSATFVGSLERETIDVAVDRLKGILSWTAERISIDRVDNLTFASDVRAAIASIDRGFPDNSLNPVDETVDIFAKTVTILANDQIRAHIVFDERVAFGLASNNQEDTAGFIFIVAKELAEANALLEFDKAFPGIMLQPHRSIFSAITYEQVSAAWTGYLATRFSGIFWPRGRLTRRDLLIESIKHLKASIPQLVMSFQIQRNHDELIGNLLPHIEAILRHGAAYAGFSDAVEAQDLLDEELEAILKSVNLSDWYLSFVRELRLIWSKKGNWQTPDDFFSLGRHTERILWQCGIVLSPKGNTECHIDYVKLGGNPERIST